MDAESNDTRTALTPGVKLGPYEILGWLGQGGMGQVHRAVDSRLGRNVAIKISAEQFSGRFEREARAISALNHPHVCTLYDVGPNYLVMELVEGETLAAQLARGPLPIEQVLRYGVQIADALAAAHALGIIHRDLKPGNIMIARHGVKVLDFGLAKIADTSDLPRQHEETLTMERAIMGTPAYMAPEQLRGEEADARTDLFSFGAVLFEMATGRRAFPLHLDRTPPPPVDTNADLRRIIGKLLEADRGRRHQSALEVLAELERALQKPTRRWWAPALAGAGVAVVVLVLALLGWLGTARPPDRSKWVQITKFPDSVQQPAFSPDGRMLTFLRGPNTFIGQGEVYVKLLPDGEPVALTRDGTLKMSPAFSPDGSRIAYTVLGQRTWDTWVLPVAGGGAPRLWLPNAEGLSWIDRQRLLYSEIKSGQHMAIATSLESRAGHRDIYVPAHEAGMAHRSYLSPDGKWVLIVEMDEQSLWVQCRLTPFDGGSAGRQVGPPDAACTAAAWSPDGKWMYLSSNAGGAFHLWRQRFPDGKPEQFTSGPTEEEGIAMAPDGQSLITAVGLRQRPTSLHDAASDRQVSSEGYTFFPLLYAEGRKVAYRMSNGYQGWSTPSEVWVADLESGRNEPALPGFRVIFLDVSRDGRLLVCALDTGGRPRLWLAGLDRRSPPRQIGSVEAERALFGPPGVIFFLALEGKSKYLFRIGEDGAGLTKIAAGSMVEFYGVSPDGGWISGMGPVPGREGDFVNAYPAGGGGPTELCQYPCFFKWSPDGKYVFFSKPVGNMSGGATGRTYVLPTRPGTMFPEMPAGGFRAAAELAAAPGARVIEAADVGPGPTPDVYVFSREFVQRNLYRIPLR